MPLRSCIRRQQPLECGKDGGHRRRDRRNGLIQLPAAAKRAIEGHEVRGGVLLGNDILLFQVVSLALRIDNIK